MQTILIKRILLMGVMSIWRHRLRSSLTILGIVFGVASVIAMLAIGEGLSYEAEEQLRQMGSQNIIINSIKPPQEEAVSAEAEFTLEYGLTYKDAERIRLILQSVEVLVPSRTIRGDISWGRKKLDANIVGTVPWFLQTSKLELRDGGRFLNSVDMDGRRNVCVLSAELARRLFLFRDSVGETIRVQDDYYDVIGVLDGAKAEQPGEANGAVNSTAASGAALLDLYIPLTAARYRFGDTIINQQSGGLSSEKVELHQIIVKFESDEAVMPNFPLVQDILASVHKEMDYEIVVPLDLLERAKRTRYIFNIVLGSIAAISLLVGGIGIMNIMLASVTERTREIGIRRALGAKQRDIIAQFLVETILLSASGGCIGLVLGIATPIIITRYADMQTIIRLWSLGAAFGISLMIGIVFGIYPAWRAAKMDPIEALRHE